ncbi:hypothetical protein ACWGQ5_04325 [Streptomyces sp. NPDC055722]
MTAIWAGIEAGKTHHHGVAIEVRAASGCCRDASPNDKPELLQFLADGQPLGDEVTWGIDLADNGTVLAIALTYRR